VQLAEQCALWKISNGAENLFCKRSNFKWWVSAAIPRRRKLSLMLAINRSLLSREEVLINVLKAMASIISIHFHEPSPK
jgi:hypothetical protein